jgi:hypothetical protein
MRNYHPPNPNKAAWARARASALREQAYAAPTVSSHHWRGVRRRTALRSQLLAEAARLDALARRAAGADGEDETPF